MMKNIIVLALFAGTFNWCVAQIPAYVPTQDLAAWYSFDGNYLDASPNNNHLTPMNTANRTLDRFGNPNSAFLASTSGYLTNTNPSFTLSPTQPFSMSIWWNKAGGTVAMMIGTTTNGNFITNMQSGSNASQFGTNRQGQAWIWAQTTVTLNTWEHYVAVYDAPNMIFYKNGVPVATNVYSHAGALSVNHPLWIGRGVAGGNFQGALDEIGIWTRALTPAEVQQLYAGCPAGFTSQPASGAHTRSSNVALIANRLAAATNSQWQVDTGAGFTDVVASARFVGVTADTLTINAIDFDLHQANFRCINSATGCADTSQVATLTVTCPNLIQTQPTAQTGRINQTATFTAAASDPATTFQWQTDDGTGFSNLSNSAAISGATTGTLTLTNLQMSQDGNLYRCMMTLGPCGDTTDAVSLTVINDVSLHELEASTIQVFPNPATQQWTIVVPNTQRSIPFSLVDAQGKRLQVGTLNPGTQILDASTLPTGTYILEMEGERAVRLVKK